MRLSLRLALTFGLLAAASSLLVGVGVRYRLAEKETARFQRDVHGLCERIATEVKRQGEADQRLVAGACQGGTLVERVGIALDRDALDEMRTGFAQIVHNDRTAFGMDELLVAEGAGEIVGASPTTLLGIPAKDVSALLKGQTQRYSLRDGAAPALVSRCTKPTPGGHVVGMVGARHVDPVLGRLAQTLDVSIVPAWKREKGAPGTGAEVDRVRDQDPSRRVRETCRLDDGVGTTLTVDVLKSTRELDDSLEAVDRTTGVFALIASVVAFLVAVLLARSLSRPLAVLAAEAGKVAAGEARPLAVRGSGEIRELGSAFDRMIQDLAVTRRRLAAASRVAAWREVARRVAHEVKNPLAPIRAAVETLRRLRARDDPRFDEYFDEATRTVLDEVHRISNIVSEFTRFARLPTPKMGDVDVEDVARHVVQTHKAAAGEGALLAHHAQRRAPKLRADRDQVIQVLTNLVQNALDAIKDVSNGAVTVATDTDGAYVTFSVTDNGPGIAPEIAARLFEPYATTKANGTGLGLAIAQRIAIEHNGELSYLGTSASGKGAVFRLMLPIEGPAPLSDTPSGAPSDAPPE